jgi:hypothetical protein
MAQPISLRTSVAVALATFSLTAMSFAQSAPSATKASPAPPKAQAAVPVTMTECEGINNCATWTFLGGQGNGQWPSGEVANLSVERSDTNSVVIRRADSTGASAGLTAVYTGTRHDDRVGGEFTSTWPGHWTNKSGFWYAIVEKNGVPPPSVMRVCDPVGSCGTWTWNNGHYDGSWSNVTATLTVEKFTPESVIIRRVDTGARVGFVYIYSGKISSQGNSILDGDWLGEAGSRQAGVAGHFTATWGTALQNNPAARQPVQPQTIVVPAVCIPWFFTIVCG